MSQNFSNPAFQTVSNNRRWRQKLNYKAKAVALAIACLIPMVANRTSAYNFTTASITQPTAQVKQARVTAPADTASEPLDRLPLTLIIETAVAALLLVGLIAAYLANRAVSPITSAASAKKLDEEKLDSEDVEFSQLAPFVQNQTSLSEQPEASGQQSSLSEQPETALEQLSLIEQLEVSRKQSSLLERPEASLELIQLLKEFNLRIRQSLYIEDILKNAVKEVRRLIKTDRVLIYGLDSTNWYGVVIAESVATDWPQLLGVKLQDPCLHEQCLEMYKHGRIRAINNIHEEPGLKDCHIRTLEQFAVKANLVAPILRYGQLLGLIIAHHCSAPRTWEKSDVDLFGQLANQVGLAVGQASLLEEQEAAVERAQLLAEITRRLHKSVYLEDLLKTTVKEVRRALKTDRVVIYGFEPNNWDGIIVEESVAPGWPQMLKVRISDPCFKERHVELYKHGRVRAINNIHEEPGLTDCHIKMLEQFAVKASLVVPIRKNDQLIALMIAHHCSEPHVWHQSDVDLVTQLATQVGIAVDQLSGLKHIALEQVY